MKLLRLLWLPLILPALAAIAALVFLAWLFWPLRKEIPCVRSDT